MFFLNIQIAQFIFDSIFISFLLKKILMFKFCLWWWFPNGLSSKSKYFLFFINRQEIWICTSYFLEQSIVYFAPKSSTNSNFPPFWKKPSRKYLDLDENPFTDGSSQCLLLIHNMSMHTPAVGAALFMASGQKVLLHSDSIISN